MTSRQAPFFSIIIPTYNRAQFLPKTIESVTAQTFDDWELIIVDDGSKDNTREVVLSYNDGRIQYVYQDNAERSAARNNGIARARGKYVCFLDSDDYYLNNHLAGLFSTIESRQEAKAMFVTDVVRNEKGTLVAVEHEAATEHYNSVCYILSAKESVIPGRVAIHHEILEKYRFNTHLKDVEDTDLWVTIAAHFPLYQTKAATVVYTIHELNSTNLKFNSYANQLKGLKKIFGNAELRLLIPARVKNEKLSYCYFGIARYYEYNKQFIFMALFLLKSIGTDPFFSNTKHKIYMILQHLPEIFSVKKTVKLPE